MAEDYTTKRRELAGKAIDAATRAVEAIQYLAAMGPELAQCGGGFADADFDPTPSTGAPTIAHVNAWKMNTLVNVVAPALKAAAASPIAQGADVTFTDILLAVKRA